LVTHGVRRVVAQAPTSAVTRTTTQTSIRCFRRPTMP
jgi:hypothetical protein